MVRSALLGALVSTTSATDLLIYTVPVGHLGLVKDLTAVVHGTPTLVWKIDTVSAGTRYAILEATGAGAGASTHEQGFWCIPAGGHLYVRSSSTISVDWTVSGAELVL